MQKIIKQGFGWKKFELGRVNDTDWTAEDTRVALFVTPVWFILLIAIYKMRNLKENYVDQVSQEKKVAEN